MMFTNPFLFKLTIDNITGLFFILWPIGILFANEGSYTFQTLSVPCLLIIVMTLIVKKNYKRGAQYGYSLLFILGIFIISNITTIFFPPRGFVVNDYYMLIRLIYYMMIFLTFIICTNAQFSDSVLKLSSHCYIVTSTLISIYILCVFLSGMISKISITTFLGVYVDPNALGAYGTISAIFIGYKLCYVKKVLYKIFYIGLLLFQLFVIALIGSRAAFIAVILGYFALLCLFQPKGKVKKYYYITGAVILVCLSVFIFIEYLPAFNFERLFIRDYADNSNIDRITFWLDAIEAWSYRPIFGYGLGSYITQEIVGNHAAILRNPSTHAHSTFFDLLLDGGIIGLVIYLIFLKKIIWDCCKNKKNVLLALMVTIIFTSSIIMAFRMVYLWYGIIFVVQASNDSCKLESVFG